MAGSELVLRPCQGAHEWPRLAAVWRSAVEATHSFLTPADVEHYGRLLLSDYLGSVDLLVAEGRPGVVAFAGTRGAHLAMLFVGAEHRGLGVGTRLVDVVAARYPELSVDVNEQNPDALAFYLRRGFRVVGRSALDNDGRPFPLVHLVRP